MSVRSGTGSVHRFGRSGSTLTGSVRRKFAALLHRRALLTSSSIERYPAGVVWPQIICETPHLFTASILFSWKLTMPACANQNLGIFPTQVSVPLRFPPFYPSVTQSLVWDPADETGRITVEVSEGYIENVEGQDRFTKLKNHALFNFQPVPLSMFVRIEMKTRDKLIVSRCPPTHWYRMAQPRDVPESSPASTIAAVQFGSVH